MKTEKELLGKYYEMLTNTRKLDNIVNNPPDNYTFDKIKEEINYLNTQLEMNSIFEWVVGITNDKKIRINESGLIPVCFKGINDNGETELFDCEAVFMETLTIEQINEFYENGFVTKK